jgi:bifunctional non-homologous end joining protein LigD
LAADAVARVAGVRITHPDRVVYPDLGLTKLDVARYYESVGGWIVPHVKDRPLTLVHCPSGLAAPCRYMRHSKVWGPGLLRRVKIREKTKIGEYLVADTVQAVVGLAQMGVLEIHTWNSTTARLEQPDRIVWDLDPGPDVAWKQVVTAATTLRSVLQVLNLQAWVKTTGGRGLHIVVPLRPRRVWSECLVFARGVADVLERHEPALFTTAYAKRGRERRILIDYLRNNRTNTSIAAFSTRARPGAPVSIPIAWKELGQKPRTYSLAQTRSSLGGLRSDPWSGYWRCRQEISDRAFRALGRI